MGKETLTYVGGGSDGPVFRQGNDIVKIKKFDLEPNTREITISNLIKKMGKSHWFVIKDYKVIAKFTQTVTGLPKEYEWIYEQGPKLYLVQEKAGDKTLAEYLASQGDSALGKDTIRAILYQLLWGAYVAHSRYGIAHGDIKPENIMVEELKNAETLTYAIPTGRQDEIDYMEVSTKVVVRYIDVGASRIDVKEELLYDLSSALQEGTAIYRSPDEPRGVASDLWAIGVVATALAATGRHKFGKTLYTYKKSKEPPVFYGSSEAEEGPFKGDVPDTESMENIISEFVTGKKNSFQKLRNAAKEAMGENGLLLLKDLFQPDAEERMDFGIDGSGYGANSALFHPYFVLDGKYWKGSRNQADAKYTTDKPHSKPLRNREDIPTILMDIENIEENVYKELYDMLKAIQGAEKAEQNRDQTESAKPKYEQWNEARFKALTVEAVKKLENDDIARLTDDQIEILQDGAVLNALILALGGNPTQNNRGFKSQQNGLKEAVQDFRARLLSGQSPQNKQGAQTQDLRTQPAVKVLPTDDDQIRKKANEILDRERPYLEAFDQDISDLERLKSLTRNEGVLKTIDNDIGRINVSKKKNLPNSYVDEYGQGEGKDKKLNSFKRYPALTNFRNVVERLDLPYILKPFDTKTRRDNIGQKPLGIIVKKLLGNPATKQLVNKNGIETEDDINNKNVAVLSKIVKSALGMLEQDPNLVLGQIEQTNYYRPVHGYDVDRIRRHFVEPIRSVLSEHEDVFAHNHIWNGIFKEFRVHPEQSWTMDDMSLPMQTRYLHCMSIMNQIADCIDNTEPVPRELLDRCNAEWINVTKL